MSRPIKPGFLQAWCQEGRLSQSLLFTTILRGGNWVSGSTHSEPEAGAQRNLPEVTELGVAMSVKMSSCLPLSVVFCPLCHLASLGLGVASTYKVT